MKTSITTSIMLLFMGVAFAQSGSITIVNETSCGYIFQVVAEDSSCVRACETEVTCIQPFSTLVLGGCSDTTYFWDRVVIEPVNSEDCSACQEQGTAVSSIYANNCISLSPSSDFNSHCEGCEYSVSFTGPRLVAIY